MNWTPTCLWFLFTFKSYAKVLIAPAFLLGSLNAPAWSEPTKMMPLQSVIIGSSDIDHDLQAIWEGTLRPKMQTLTARLKTPSGHYVFSIIKDRCVNSGNVPNLFGCPARLVSVDVGKPVIIRDYNPFYFSGELPSSDEAPTYITQTGRNHTRVALDVEQAVLIVEDTNNGSTGTVTFPFPKPPRTKQ